MVREAKILLDIPEEENVSLEFDRYSEALVSIIRGTEPHFTLGIFGGWGTGKTTLMKRMEAKLKGDENILPIWFNAWRYEKEPDLLVPLLNTLKEEIEKSGKEKIRELIEKIRIIAFSFVAGIKLSSPPVEYDFSKSLERADTLLTEERFFPESRYFKAFSNMKTSFEEFSKSNSDFKFVIFIDDLDRCMPEKALEILESIKLFFDFHGFIFIVGLNNEIIEKLMDKKLEEYQSKEEEKSMKGEDYIKKIINIPFYLPLLRKDVEIKDYISKLLNKLPNSKKFGEIDTLISEGSGMNPREIKRFINDFIVIYEIGENKLNPEIILILRVLYYRWRNFYDLLSQKNGNIIKEIEQYLKKEKQEKGSKFIVTSGGAEGKINEEYPLLFLYENMLIPELRAFLEKRISKLEKCLNLEEYFYYSKAISIETVIKEESYIPLFSIYDVLRDINKDKNEEEKQKNRAIKWINENKKLDNIGRDINIVMSDNEEFGEKLVMGIDIQILIRKIGEEKNLGDIGWCIAAITRASRNIGEKLVKSIDIQTFRRKIELEHDLTGIRILIEAVINADKDTGDKLMDIVMRKIEKEKDLEKISFCISSIREANKEMGVSLVGNLDINNLCIKILKEKGLKKIGLCIGAISGMNKEAEEKVFNIIRSKLVEERDPSKIGRFVRGITRMTKEAGENVFELIRKIIEEEKNFTKYVEYSKVIMNANKEFAEKLFKDMDIQYLKKKMENEQDLENITSFFEINMKMNKEVIEYLIKDMDIQNLRKKIEKEKDLEIIRNCTWTITKMNNKIGEYLIKDMDIQNLKEKIEEEKDFKKIRRLMWVIIEINKSVGCNLLELLNLELKAKIKAVLNPKC